MINNLLILPNQLFYRVKTMDINNIILFEAEEYFEKYKYNQKKILLHRASMQNYYQELLDKLKETKITYFDYRAELKEFLREFKTLTIFDPINKDIKQKIIDISAAEGIELTVLKSPNFLTSAEQNAEYFKNNNFFQHKYYQMQRNFWLILLKTGLNFLVNIRMVSKKK